MKYIPKTATPAQRGAITTLCEIDSYLPTVEDCLSDEQKKALRPEHLSATLANVADLFLTHYEGIAEAYARGNSIELNFKVNLAADKDTVTLQYKPVEVMKDSASINLPEQNQPDLPGIKPKKPEPKPAPEPEPVEVAAEVLGLPAPPAEVLGLPAPESDAGEPQFVAPLTDEQKAQIEAIREAGQDCRSEGNSILENPHPFCSNERAIWREGWNMQDRFMSGTAAPSETDTAEDEYIASQQQAADDDIPIGTRADAPGVKPPATETQPDPPKRPRARKAKADVVIDVPAEPAPGGVEIFEKDDQPES